MKRYIIRIFAMLTTIGSMAFLSACSPMDLVHKVFPPKSDVSTDVTPQEDPWQEDIAPLPEDTGIEDITVADETPVDEQPVETVEPMPEVTPEPTPTPVVLYAKTYKEVHSELYNFYPTAGLTYTKWVYKIDGESDFIGSIIYPDGTVVYGKGSAGNKNDDVEVNVDIGSHSSQQPANTDPVQSSTTVQKDKTVNPTGVDLTLKGMEGSEVNITTKTVANAIVNTQTQTDMYVEFSTSGNKQYVLSVESVESAMRKLFDTGLYSVTGTITINSGNTKVTSGGTFTQYDINTQDGSKPYAVTYVPAYTTNTVYLLTAKELDAAKDLMSIMQLIIEERQG